jgi:hypothetical protein
MGHLSKLHKPATSLGYFYHDHPFSSFTTQALCEMKPNNINDNIEPIDLVHCDAMCIVFHFHI